MSDDSRHHRIQALDSLRGVAILAVVIYHAGSPLESGSGFAEWVGLTRSFLWTGVDLFFVLSGFLITRILLRTREDPRFFRTFYVRRALRVFPLFYLFVGAALFLPRIVTFLQPTSDLIVTDAYQKLWEGQSWIWLYLHNFIQARGPSQFPGMGHMWSLAVEEQFYLVWPWLVWRTDDRKLGWLLTILLVATSMGRLIASANGYSAWAIMHQTWFRLDGLVVGSLVALAHQRSETTAQLRSWRSSVFFVSAALVVTVGWLRGTFEWMDPGVQRIGFLAFALAAGCVVDFVVERDRQNVAQSRRPNTVAQHLAMWGKYSYAIYIFHMPVIHILRHLWPRWGDGAVTLLAAVISLLVGIASWYLYEAHWLRWKPPYARTL